MKRLEKLIGKTIKNAKCGESFMGGPGCETDKGWGEHYDGGIIIEFTDGTSVNIDGLHDEGIVVTDSDDS